jgi:transcriptional regulator with XRE-family HTH domain
MIISEQIRAARALLGLSQEDLARSASIGIATLRRFEAARREIRGNAETLWKIQIALEKAGVSFIDADDKAGPGVRLRSD